VSAKDLFKQEESEALLAQLDADAAGADTGNKVYTIEETRETVRSVAAQSSPLISAIAQKSAQLPQPESNQESQ
jgi:hypothetical protein